MSYDTLAAPTRITVDYANDIGVIADVLEWNNAQWWALLDYVEDRLDATGKTFGQMTLHELQSAVWAAGPKGYVSHVNCLIGKDDATKHDLFRVARKLLRIYDLPMVHLLKLFEVLERCPGTVEDLTLRNLLALISIVDLDDAPCMALPLS